VSTPIDELTADFRQPRDENQGMGFYLAEWRQYRGMKPAVLAKKIGVHRSLVSKWETRERALTNVNHINRICEVLKVSQEDLAKKPPATMSEELMISSEMADNPIHSASEADQSEGNSMVKERIASIQIIGALPPELMPTALQLLQSLRDAVGVPTTRPSPRGRASE
jgi:transcriptional regulator with XRE-family HTH domain